MNTFLSAKKMKSRQTGKTSSEVAYEQCSSPQLLRTSPLKAFQLQILSYDANNRGDLGRPDIGDISRQCCEFGTGHFDSEPYRSHIIDYVFVRADTSRSVAALTSVH